jgi:glutamine synthetase
MDIYKMDICQWVVEYVWLDAEGGFRSKIRAFQRKSTFINLGSSTSSKMIANVINGIITKADVITEEEWKGGDHDWNYDGSSTGQAETKSSDVILKPIAIYPHPLLQESYLGGTCPKAASRQTHIPHQFRLIFCHSELPDGSPAPGCNYEVAKAAFERPGVKEAEYWFGIEQEYFFKIRGAEYPVGFTKRENLRYEPVEDRISDDHQNQAIINRYHWKYPEGNIYYCGMGADSQSAVFRKIAERHLAVCGEMGIPMGGINAEVVNSQWEYQVGPSVGIQAAFDLWVTRYILVRIAEENGYAITFHPKPLANFGMEERMEGGEIVPIRVTPAFNGSGCHVNVSNARMRANRGYAEILFLLPILGARHTEFLKLCGKDNHLRLNGKCETSDPNIFSWSVGGRDTSIRIGHKTERDQKGYFEDRRPGSNMDPFLVLGEYLVVVGSAPDIRSW